MSKILYNVNQEQWSKSWNTLGKGQYFAEFSLSVKYRNSDSFWYIYNKQNSGISTYMYLFQNSACLSLYLGISSAQQVIDSVLILVLKNYGHY